MKKTKSGRPHKHKRDKLTKSLAEGSVYPDLILKVGKLKNDPRKCRYRVAVNRALPDKIRGEAWSWKRFLRDAATNDQGLVLKALWDRLPDLESVEKNLVQIIGNEPDVAPWRAAIIATPKVYEYGIRRMLRFDHSNQRIYILNKSYMNSTHAELFTYCLWQKLLASPSDLEFELEYYDSTCTDNEPGLYLSRRYLRTNIDLFVSLREIEDGNGYHIYLDEPKKPGPKLCAALAGNGFTKEEGPYSKLEDFSDLENEIRNLDNVLRN